MSPEFFMFSDNSWRNTRYPRLEYVRIPKVLESDLLLGGESKYPISVPGIATADVVKGGKWADVLGWLTTGLATCIVSDRVVEALHELDPTSFDAYPVKFEEIKSKALKQTPPPKYYYLVIHSRIELDIEQSGIIFGLMRDDPSQKRICGNDRYVPKYETWDGSAIFIIGEGMHAKVCCSFEFMQLARERQWSNFRFVPMTAEAAHSSSGAGIDYLGKEWPPVYPMKWYPVRASYRGCELRIHGIVEGKYQISSKDQRMMEYLENCVKRAFPALNYLGELPVDAPGIIFLEQDPWRKGLRIKEEFEIPRQSRV